MTLKVFYREDPLRSVKVPKANLSKTATPVYDLYTVAPGSSTPSIIQAGIDIDNYRHSTFSSSGYTAQSIEEMQADYTSTSLYRRVLAVDPSDRSLWCVDDSDGSFSQLSSDEWTMADGVYAVKADGTVYMAVGGSLEQISGLTAVDMVAADRDMTDRLAVYSRADGTLKEVELGSVTDTVEVGDSICSLTCSFKNLANTTSQWRNPFIALSADGIASLVFGYTGSSVNSMRVRNFYGKIKTVLAARAVNSGSTVYSTMLYVIRRTGSLQLMAGGNGSSTSGGIRTWTESKTVDIKKTGVTWVDMFYATDTESSIYLIGRHS